jgi:hypothetical protein
MAHHPIIRESWKVALAHAATVRRDGNAPRFANLEEGHLNDRTA